MGSYFGSKATSGLCQPIIALMPPHDGGRELIYSDPPYLHHTRTSGHRYRFDYEEQDHIELLELLKTLPCNVILSGYPSALYDERLTGWRTLELQVMNHAGVRTEKLWFNFTPDRVHWASWRGQEFHRPPAHQAPCRELGEELPGTTREERLAVLAAMMAV
uniref:DNA methylase n=1 Tax=Thiolapillus sp. TaxID=2017437 RepID=UPI003AF7E170